MKLQNQTKKLKEMMLLGDYEIWLLTYTQIHELAETKNQIFFNKLKNQTTVK